jgi:hypothetical protein
MVLSYQVRCLLALALALSNLRPIETGFGDDIRVEFIGTAIKLRYRYRLVGAMSKKVASMMSAAVAGFVLTCDIFFNPAGAVDECLIAPNSPPPSGSHWYYRVERSTQRKCWYIGPEGREVRSVSPKLPVKRPASPSTSVARDQPTPFEQTEEPSMPEHPAIAVSDPATKDALGAPTSAPLTVNRRPIVTPRIASSANVTQAAPLVLTPRLRPID